MVHTHFSQSGWITRGRTHARGNAYHHATLLKAEGLLDHFAGSATPSSLLSSANQVNGFFAFVQEDANSALALVDRVRSIPVFYCVHRGELYVSDSAHWIKEKLGLTDRDPMAELEFLLAGFVTGPETLYEGIRQLGPGRLMRAERSQQGWRCIEESYFSYEPRNSKDPGNETALLKRLEEATKAAFQRLVRWADGRTIVVPLSDGYDSRLVAGMLKRLRYPNVLTFSYGRPGNRASEISRKLANQLGYRWEFVAYTNELWASWFSSDEYAQYSRRGGNLSTIGHIQDFPAVRELTRFGKIPPDAVFVPGHTGDFVAGGHIPSQFWLIERVGIDQFVEAIWQKHYALWDWRGTAPLLEPVIRDRVLRLVSYQDLNLPTVASRELETWNWNERQAKHIINSVRVYEHFGYDWWLPLWDAEFVDFWADVPFHWKLGKRLRNRYVDIQSESLSLNNDAVTVQQRGGIGGRSLVELAKRNDFLYRVGLKLHEKIVKRVRRQARLLSEYDRHPLAWYGLVPRDRFAEIYTGQEEIRSFLALNHLGYSTFDEAVECLIPRVVARWDSSEIDAASSDYSGLP